MDGIIAYCAACDIRACGIERGVAHCAHCPAYHACDRLAGFFARLPAHALSLKKVEPPSSQGMARLESTASVDQPRRGV
jgi:hypothetical protein